MTKEAEAKAFFINLDLESPERFDMSRFMLYDEDVFEPITSHVLETIKGLEAGGQYVVTGEDYRPDSVSDKIYGTTEYWWILLIYNEKLSFNDLQHGDEIRFPSIQALEDLYFSLKVQQNNVDRED